MMVRRGKYLLCLCRYSLPRGVAQLGSALRSGRRGRGFKSRHPDQRKCWYAAEKWQSVFLIFGSREYLGDKKMKIVGKWK